MQKIEMCGELLIEKCSLSYRIYAFCYLKMRRCSRKNVKILLNCQRNNTVTGVPITMLW